MSNETLQAVINKLIDSISAQIPAYQSSDVDWQISDGNVAV
ncbi:hypothetical protein [Spirosoma humi]